MSFDESSAAGAAGDHGLEIPPPEPSADRPVRGASVLSWTLPPRLAADACAEVERAFAECEHRYDSKELRVYAVWLRHLMRLGFLTAKELRDAMQTAHPYLNLHSLQVCAGRRLVAHLEAIISKESFGYSQLWQQNLTVDLMRVSECEEPMLLISLDGPYVFHVKSLNTVPLRLARLVYESLYLLNRTLQPCILAHELWRDEASFLIDEGEETYKMIQKAGGLRNLPAAIRIIKRHKLTDYFSADPESLREELTYFRSVLHMRPSWMRGHSTQQPIIRTRQLVKLLGQYEIERGPHPWLDYARHVCRSILAHFKDEQDLKRAMRRVFRHYESEVEMALPLFQSLVISSASAVETQHLEDLAQRQAETGETAAERFYLGQMASSTLRYILELRATGIGLLARADAVDDSVLRGRYARRTQ